ncbi:MAG: hypothetical protein IJK18_09440 [Clostridia bacterium]|nr:hypothetical protein [Clostridia bacterium]
MRIYIGHSKKIDYKNELYEPLRKDNFFNNHELILPHEKDEFSSNSREFYKTIDVFIAECSDTATGLGIELGWAFDDNKKIYCIYKKGKKVSGSLKSVTNNFYEYNDLDEMVNVVKLIINKEK